MKAPDAITPRLLSATMRVTHRLLDYEMSDLRRAELYDVAAATRQPPRCRALMPPRAELINDAVSSDISCRCAPDAAAMLTSPSAFTIAARLA